PWLSFSAASAPPRPLREIVAAAPNPVSRSNRKFPSRSATGMLHITNGGATLTPLEQSGVPGAMASWDDVLHEGPTPLAVGEDWLRVRVRYLASAGYGTEEEMLRDLRAKGDPLDAAGTHDEVVFWFEHDLHCQLLLIRHLWWLAQ